MIKRNSPGQVIYLPCLRNDDGARVTVDASITIGKDGLEAAGAGTLAHVAGGIWKYTFTQAETNAAIIGLILVSDGDEGTPVVVNVVTTNADTAAVRFGAPIATDIATAVHNHVYEAGPFETGSFAALFYASTQTIIAIAAVDMATGAEVTAAKLEIVAALDGLTIATPPTSIDVSVQSTNIEITV